LNLFDQIKNKHLYSTQETETNVAQEEKQSSAKTQNLFEIIKNKHSYQQQVVEDVNIPTTSEEDPSGWTKFEYGFDSTGNILTNLSDYLEAEMPLIGGEFTLNGYISPDEKYGEDFTSLPFEERRKRIVQYREEQLAKEYPVITALKQQGKYKGGIEEGIGTLAKVIADPTTLLPVGQTVKAGAAIGAGIGATYSVAEDLAKKDRVDAQKAVTSSLLGGGLGGAGAKLTQVAGKALQKRADNKLINKANEQIEEVNQVISRGIASGVSEKDIPVFVQKATQRSPEDIAELLLVGNSRLRIPTREAALAEQELIKGIEKTQSAPSKFTEGLVGVLSTSIQNISPALQGRLRKFERDVSVKTHESLQEVKPFLSMVSKATRKRFSPLSNAEKTTLNMHLNNGDFDDAVKILSKVDKNAPEEVVKVQNLLDRFYNELAGSGYDIPKIKNYFPREVKDRDGLFATFGSTKRGIIENALRKKAQQLDLPSTKDLPSLEEELIINQVVRGYVPKVDGARLSSVKDRKLPRLTEKQSEFYENPAVRLDSYIREVVNDIEKRKFFGRNVAVNDTSGKKIDLDKSVGRFIANEIEVGNVSFTKADELSELIQARFGLGEKAPHKVLRVIRNLGYGATLGNPIAAMIQLADIGVTAYKQGFSNTIKAMVAGNKQISMKELGLDDIMNHELNNAVDTSKLLGRILRFSGFRAMDRYGKDVFLRASFNKGVKLANSAEGRMALSNKYRKSFGRDEFEQLVKELQAGEVTDRVKLFVWNELSDVQPISLSEVPKAYLNSPNGRIFYALKSFTIKQLDILRKDIYQQAKKGNLKEATRNAVGYMLLVGGLNGVIQEVKDAMLTKGEAGNLEDIPDNMVEHIFKNFGASEYIIDRYGSQGKVAQAVINTLSPPVGYIDDIGTDIIKLVTEGDVLPERTIKNLPVFGKLWYMYFGGGMEKMMEREEEEKRKERGY